jgi:hypothetical protein
MTGGISRESALELIVANPGISDRELAEQAFGPGTLGSAVNAVCRALADAGLTRRRLRRDGLLGNWPTRDGRPSG